MILDGFVLSDSSENESGEFFPLLSVEDEERIQNEAVPDELPILPLRNTVLFPGVIIPITVGRDKSIRLVREVYRGNRIIGVVSQKDADLENPTVSDLNSVGTVAYIIKLLQMPDGSNTIIIQGRNRFRIEEMIQEEPYFRARVSMYGKPHKVSKSTKSFDAVLSSIRELALRITKDSPNVPSEASFAIQNIESPSFLVNFVSGNLTISLEEKQKLLEMVDFNELSGQVLQYLTREVQMLELKAQIQQKVKTDIDKQQRDYFLNMQLKTIQEELGGSPHEQEINELKEKAVVKNWPDTVAQTFQKELNKLQRMNPSAAEYSIQLNYLEYLVELPWNDLTQDNFDMDHAATILDEDHFGLEKVKERVLEYLAVLKLKGDMKSPIICLVGPPGVGKTSLGKSIARALGRKYVRMSLGGMRDESELRGHRKTYIGAMPGRLIQNLRKVQSSNPVFVLDEIDKVSGNNIQGDPQAALLEVLDPEQNSAFYDNYLEIDYDLSKVLFIATANNLAGIHSALRDRLEIIDISGYSLEEKVEIAKRHLVPKQMAENGVEKGKLSFSEQVLKKIISDHTKESGVRALEKAIAKIIRFHARKIASDDAFSKKVGIKDVDLIMGVPRFYREMSRRKAESGIVTGLAWTVYGGEILFIEASLSKGKEGMSLTGNLGDVMKESATLAYEYLKAHAAQFGIDQARFVESHLHMHVPEGATPKDGPSAGITMFTALASLFLNRKVRANIAMTGEITLRGKVLPVGGVKEKILAARRSGIDDVVLSADNKKDVDEIESRYLEGFNFHYIKEMKEVIDIALI